MTDSQRPRFVTIAIRPRNPGTEFPPFKGNFTLLSGLVVLTATAEAPPADPNCVPDRPREGENPKPLDQSEFELIRPESGKSHDDAN